jgi:hypothetical protein
MGREKLGDLTPRQKSRLLKLLGDASDLTVVHFGGHTYQVIRTRTRMGEPSHVATIGQREAWYENSDNNVLADYRRSVYLKYTHATSP